MPEPTGEVLKRQVAYSGEGISVRSLEETIGKTRAAQDVKVQELGRLRERNAQLQKALADEVRKLRKLSDYLGGGRLKVGWGTRIKELLSYIPGLRNLAVTQRSIEELLRQQYEISALRVKEAAEFADRLRGAESDLRDEIARLNEKIIESARNEETAAAYLLEVKDRRETLEAELATLEAGSARAREVQAEIDEARRVLSDHSTRLQLYHTAEERLARLKENTLMLAETVRNLYGDISQYVQAANEKLDLAAGQIQAIGTAADASVVMLELKKSLDVMTDSMNQTTRFVSETQVYFRKTIDHLVEELELYDDQTRKLLQQNLEQSRELEDRRIAAAVEVAMSRKAGQAEPAPGA